MRPHRAGSGHTRWGLAAAALAPFALAACAAGDGASTMPSTSASGRGPASTATTEALDPPNLSTTEPTEPTELTEEARSTTTGPAPPTSGAATPTYDSRCDDPAALTGDVDGDGTDDRVLHTFTDPVAGARLLVCTADGAYLETTGAGMAEVLTLHDIDGDGSDRIFFGSTTAGAELTSVAVVDAGALTAVVGPDELPLVLTRGIPVGGSPTVDRAAWGCDDLDGDGRVEIVQATGKISPDGAVSYQLIGWRVEGSTAVTVTDPDADRVREVEGATDGPANPLDGVVGTC